MIVVGTGSAPALSSLASSATSSSVNCPVIWPESVMMPWIVASETNFLSRKMPSCLPRLFLVSRPNLCRVLRLEVDLRLAAPDRTPPARP